MAIDLAGGMSPSKDYFLSEQPEDPQFRESASFWVSDDKGLIGLPRVGIEAVSESWDNRGLQVNLGFPDGRTAIVRGNGKGRSPVDTDGVCRTLAAGGLEFGCVEPFRTLTLTYDGDALDTTAAALAKGDYAGPQVPLHVEVELTCAVPPWVSGTLSEESKELFDSGFAGAFISPRYEQLARRRAACASEGTSGCSRELLCGSTGRGPAMSGAFGVTVGRARCFRVARASGLSPSRNGPTNPPTTRLSFSTANA